MMAVVTIVDKRRHWIVIRHCRRCVAIVFDGLVVIDSGDPVGRWVLSFVENVGIVL